MLWRSVLVESSNTLSGISCNIERISFIWSIILQLKRKAWCNMFYIVPKARSSVRLKRAHTVQRLHVGHLTNTYSILVRFTLSLFIFSVRLLPILRGHSVFSSSPQRPMTSDFEGFLIPDFIHIHLNSSERASISLLMLSAKQRNYWYHFY